MTAPDSPFDPGLQPERTLLAWRRTFLALGVAGAVAVRFAAEVSLHAAVPLGIVLIAAACAGYARVARRYRRAHEGLTGSGTLDIDGLALAFMAVTLLAICACALVYVVGAALELVSAGQ